MSELGRPKPIKTTGLVPTIAAHEQALAGATADTRSLEAQRLAREQAQYDAEFATRTSSARGVVYAVVAVIALFALVDLVQAASGTLSALFRGALTALLAYHVFLGKPWARVVILALAAVSSLTVIPRVLMLMKLAPVFGLLIGLVFSGLLGGCIALFLNPAKHYFYDRN